MKSSHPAIEIVPGRSIGEVRLGAKVVDLPSRAVINAPAGQLDDVRFVLKLESNEVEDIWIDDVRTFSHPLTYNGKVIDPKASIEQLEEVFGKCERVTGVKGLIFYNCAAGVALGTNFSRTILQIRVRPR